MKGTIVFLNGVSSSGKSSLAKEIIRLKPGFFHLSADDYADWVNGMEDQPHRLIPVATERFFHRTVAMFSAAGVNVVVDSLLHDEATAIDCCEVLQGHPVLLVGVQCSVEELERRERTRADRKLGLAREQLSFVHMKEVYDVVVNTYDEEIGACAKQVVEGIQSKSGGEGWRSTCERYLKQ